MHSTSERDGDTESSLRSAALVDELARRIHAGILAGELAVGTWLRQAQLADQFGVSRTPVREALRILQADGIVRLVPNRGALVRGPTVLEIREAYVMRAELEGLAASLAATHVAPEEQRRIDAAHRTFRDAARRRVRQPMERNAEIDDPWIKANDAFHDAIADIARNGRVRDTIADLRRSFPTQSDLGALLEDPSLIADTVNQHERIRAAIARRDPAAGRAWMVDHVRRSGELVAIWFERTHPVDDGDAQPEA